MGLVSGFRIESKCGMRDAQNATAQSTASPTVVVDADPVLSHRAPRPQRHQHRSLSENSDRIIQNVVTNGRADHLRPRGRRRPGIRPTLHRELSASQTKMELTVVLRTRADGLAKH